MKIDILVKKLTKNRNILIHKRSSYNLRILPWFISYCYHFSEPDEKCRPLKILAKKSFVSYSWNVEAMFEYCFILVSQQPSVNHKTKSNKGI